ncbi:FAD-dependent pyridine nucleotide-disulfide oxidoreductase [Halosimplex carlsbadense 2-9-1]|uniref:FAD-dependent pyridine nucleotide-disulfide oxidoreductase n=1 Tax=Halosimplex carlsbadense 2-9-1 TaxID=797114 RepID=M0CD66_9EURY|nr:FAD-binding protein [Halosimplex carlsbadense]ELZ20558.1 FAD-dependent pyridine nucleotide-disulfide oxidoreductase [Halosimplex carlsbadense 2-9-1]
MAAPMDVVVVGGGVAGRSAAVFTARHGFDTLVVDSGESILRRNAHLENFPGFPAGVNGRQLLDLLEEQASDAGCEQVTATVTRVERTDEGFAVETGDGDRYHTTYVVAATKNAVGYLDGIDGVGIIDRGKAFVDTDERGRTGVDGLYAAGRLAEKPHQAIVCAGHGAEVGVTILEDDDRPFYHDWVAPDGYFTERGRDLPPGCEEIDEAERTDREARSLDVMGERFAEPHPDEQVTHPSLADE